VNEVSRRGFLKGMGAAAAMAAAPGGVGKLAKTVAEPAAAAVAEPAAVAVDNTLSRLFQTAVSFGMNQEPSIYDEPEYDDDNDNGDGEINWNEADAEYQGTTGHMPYGEYYEALQTPEKNWYLVTTDPGGYRAIVTYIKNGEAEAMMLDWDYNAQSYGEVVDATDPDDIDLFLEYPGDPGNAEELGPVVDLIINGGSAKSVDKSIEHSPETPENPMDMRTWPQFKEKNVAGVGSGLKDLFRGNDSDTAPGKNIAALPAPTNPEFTVGPGIKSQQQVPVGTSDTSNNALSAESADPRVEKSIMFRIMSNHRNLLLKYTPKRVSAAVEQVANSVGPVDEFDSNTVTNWVNQVEQVLATVAEATAVKTRLDPACWPGKKIGKPKTKVKGGVRVNNCVPK